MVKTCESGFIMSMTEIPWQWNLFNLVITT